MARKPVRRKWRLFKNAVGTWSLVTPYQNTLPFACETHEQALRILGAQLDTINRREHG